MTAKMRLLLMPALLINQYLSKIVTESRFASTTRLQPSLQVYEHNYENSYPLIDKCTQLQLTVDRVVSNVEMLSCGRSEVHLIGTVPTLVIDNSEGIQVYLGSEDSRRVNLFTSKCSEINVCLPSQSENRADIVELAVPVQFKTWVDQSNCLQTEPVKYAG